MSFPNDPEYWRERLKEHLAWMKDGGKDGKGYEPDTINDRKSIVGGKTMDGAWIERALENGQNPGAFSENTIKRYLSSKSLGRNTEESYTTHIRGWCQWYGEQQTSEVRRAEREDETDWEQRLREYGRHLRMRNYYKESTVVSTLRNCRVWVRDAQGRGWNPGVFDPKRLDEFHYKKPHRRRIEWFCAYWTRAWVVRAGNEGQFELHNIENCVTTLAWVGENVYDMDKIDDREEFRKSADPWPDASEGTKRNVLDQIWRFGREIQVDDLVVMPQKRSSLDSRRIAIGRVTGPYQHDALLPKDVRAHRTVEWLRTDISRESIRDDLNRQLNQPPTVFALRKCDAAYRIQHLAYFAKDPGDRNPSVEQNQPSVHELELAGRLDQAAEELFCEPSYLEELVDLLKDKGQIILYGPPGTGKTYLAQVLAQALAPEEEARSLVQFHPAYSYEDFFEGHRPVVDEDKQMTYELTSGPLATLAQRAAAHTEERHVMVIDEINRANLPRVLGELLFLLEYRDKSIQVMHRPEGGFKLPENLWFIGTMNTADRSIALIDAAMRRRFHFVPFFPEREPTASLLRKWTEENAPEQAWIPDLVSAVNRELEEALGGDHLQLGPSHFMKHDLDDDGFERVWKYNIEPFIEDQLFGKPDKIKRFRLDAVLARHGPAEFAPQPDLAADESLGAYSDEPPANDE